MIVTMDDNGEIFLPMAKPLWTYSVVEHPNGTLILSPVGPNPKAEALT